MSTTQLFMRQLQKTGLPTAFRRNIGISAVAFQKASDPIQQIFVDKIREYKAKSDGGKKLVDPSPEVTKELKSELERLTLQFGGKPGEDMTKFPEFNFPDVKIDPILTSTS